MLFPFFRKKRLRGFSFGETLLSAFILATGMTVIVATISKSLGDSLESRDAVIASELAQEGVELVINVRDNDFAAGGNGFTGFDNGRKHCRRSYDDTGNSVDCDSNQGSASRYTLSYVGDAYKHSDSAESRFSRYIYIDYDVPGPGQENAMVRSFVYWDGLFTPPNSGGSSANCTLENKCVFTEVFLTNWKTP